MIFKILPYIKALILVMGCNLTKDKNISKMKELKKEPLLIKKETT